MIMNDETITIGKSANESAASAIVRSYMGWSTGAGLLPLPGVDVLLIVGVQVKMLHDMAKVYGVPFRANMVRPLIVALLSGGTSCALAPPAASLMKTIPVVGTLAGILTLPALAAASCYATGRVFIQHFESGGTFLDFDPAKVRAHYQAQFDAAKAV
jgi:uncharacterized protein (DUF697 family)